MFKNAKYIHKRRRSPEKFIEETIRTVPISHVQHKIKYPTGTIVRVGKLKDDGWATQSILIPKKKAKK